MTIASGDIDELNQMIPDMSDYIISKDDVSDTIDNENLYYKFKDNDVPPYFLYGYGKKLTLWCIGYILILPASYFLHKLCKKVKFWEEVVGNFFFNAPLRTIIEMYIEIVLQVLINVKFIKFKNLSQVITTVFAIVFGAISLLLPFIAMTVIYHNRKSIRKHHWKMKYGMLTDELNGRSIL